VVAVVGSSYNELCARYFCPPHVELHIVPPGAAELPPRVDYHAVITRYHAQPTMAMPIVHIVGRAGARFVIIRGARTDLPPPAP